MLNFIPKIGGVTTAEMSKKLDAQRAQFQREKGIDTLLDYLDQALTEEAYDEILAALESWDGPVTVDIRFYEGVALAETGRRNEGIEKLVSVTSVNPHHFKALSMLDRYGYKADDGEDENRAGKSMSIPLPDVPIEQTEAFRVSKRRSYLFVAAVCGALLFIVYYLFFSASERDYSSLLEDPEAAISAVSYRDFETKVSKFTLIERRRQEDPAIKKILFYLYAYTVADYSLFDNEDLVSKAGFYYNLIDKKSTDMRELYSFIRGKKGEGALLFNHLERLYPSSVREMKSLDLSLPKNVDGKNFRETFLKSLMLFRRGDLAEAKAGVESVLSRFPEYELAAKLKAVIYFREVEEGIASPDKERLNKIEKMIESWRLASSEKHLLSEVYLRKGAALKDVESEKRAFYLACPGAYFCSGVIRNFLKSGLTEEASTMALYIKEKKGLSRNAEDVKLVVETASANGETGDCYFAFKELTSFFPEKVDDSILKIGAGCAESERYLKEALQFYERLQSKGGKVVESKVLELRYLLERDEESYRRLKTMSMSEKVEKEVLYSLYSVVSLRPDLSERQSVLSRLFSVEDEENRLDVINLMTRSGCVRKAVELLEKNSKAPGYGYRLRTIFNTFLLFEEADKVKDGGILDEKDLFGDLRRVKKFVDAKKFDIALREMEIIEKRVKGCFPAAFLLKAEIFRQKGDRAKTFSMMDGMIECDPNYMPGLILASELSYYQGDVSGAEKGVDYLLSNESILSPVPGIYHNLLILMKGEIMVTKGMERMLSPFLMRKLRRDFSFGEREKDKLTDIFDKLSPGVRAKVERKIRSKFRI